MRRNIISPGSHKSDKVAYLKKPSPSIAISLLLESEINLPRPTAHPLSTRFKSWSATEKMGIQDRSIERENVKDILANEYAIQGNLTKRYQISISRANPTSWPWYSLCVTLLLITRRYFREHGGKLKWPTIASIELYEVLKERVPRNPRLPLHFQILRPLKEPKLDEWGGFLSVVYLEFVQLIARSHLW